MIKRDEPGRARTCNPLIRSQKRYPIAPQARVQAASRKSTYSYKYNLRLHFSYHQD